MIDLAFTRSGFLSSDDPLTEFPVDSGLTDLDRLGRDLPSLLMDKGFRSWARAISIPPVPPSGVPLASLRLYYVRLGFLASAYVNQVGFEPATLLPRNIALPLCDICHRLDRPPILSYDGYALFNWKRFDPGGPIALGNIDTIQNFVHLYDEHWFILVHVEIEALAAALLQAIDQAAEAMVAGDWAGLSAAVAAAAQSVWAQVETLRRIPEKMDPALYYKTFRPYIRFFEGVVYEGVDTAPLNFRGETGAQSSVIPTVVAFLKIPHQPSMLTNHLADMRRFMPREHRELIEQVQWLPDPRGKADKAAYNDALEAVAAFRETHLEFARRYIAAHVRDPRGTGGTPYLEWLSQLIDETRAHKIAEMNTTLLETNLEAGAIPGRRGKVRDVYDLGDRLLLVATDRISAFDWVMPNGIPDKGRVLTGLSDYWFRYLKVPNHLIATDLAKASLSLTPEETQPLEGRVMVVRKARVVPFECVVRGYLAGSAWKEYRSSRSICGIPLPAGLKESDAIGPIFTPATKAETGHDENISFDAMASAVGKEVAETLQSMSLEVYEAAARHAQDRGLILADTKLEWGFDDETGELLLVDEVFTPDSSRYWPGDSYRPGGPQPSFDKQFVRDWLETTGWDKASPPPLLPDDVVAKTRGKYIEAFERLTGREFPWT